MFDQPTTRHHSTFQSFRILYFLAGPRILTKLSLLLDKMDIEGNCLYLANQQPGLSEAAQTSCGFLTRILDRVVSDFRGWLVCCWGTWGFFFYGVHHCVCQIFRMGRTTQKSASRWLIFTNVNVILLFKGQGGRKQECWQEEKLKEVISERAVFFFSYITLGH